MAGKLEFIIGSKGEVSIEGIDCTGTECTVMSKPFEDALGGNEVSKNLKPEYFVQLDPVEQKVGES